MTTFDVRPNDDGTFSVVVHHLGLIVTADPPLPTREAAVAVRDKLERAHREGRIEFQIAKLN